MYRCANSADARSQRAGNAAAAAQLLQAHGLAQHVAEVWGLRRRPGGPLRLPRTAARANPLLAVLVSRFQEGARLLHALGELSLSPMRDWMSGSVLGSVPLDLCSSLCMTLPQSMPQVQARPQGGADDRAAGSPGCRGHNARLLLGGPPLQPVLTKTTLQPQAPERAASWTRAPRGRRLASLLRKP